MFNGDVFSNVGSVYSGNPSGPPPTPQYSFERTCGYERVRPYTPSPAATSVFTTTSSTIRDSKSSVVDDVCFDADLAALTSQLQRFDWKGDLVDVARKLIDSQDSLEHKNGVLKFKKMLCVARQQVLIVAQDVASSGVVPRLVDFVSNSSDTELRLAAAFCLTNIAAGDDTETEAVVASGAIPAFMKLLYCQHAPLRRQVIFCLANIAGSTPENRAILASQPEYCRRIISSAAECHDPNIESIAAWNVRNLCVLPGAPLDQLLYAIAYFCDGFASPSKSEIERYSFEAVAAVCKLPEGRREVLRHRFDIIGYCCDCIENEYSEDTRVYALDILFEIGNGHHYEKETILSNSGELTLAQVLADRDNPIRIRLRCIDVLIALVKNGLPGHASRLLSSGCPLRRRLQAVEESYINAIDDATRIQIPLFHPATNVETKISPVDVCLDVCFQRGGPEEPVVRQSAALFVNLVIQLAPIEALSVNNRVEEMIPILVEAIDRGVSYDGIATSGALYDTNAATGDCDSGMSDGTGSPDKRVEEILQRASNGFSTEGLNFSILTALGALEKLVGVGVKVSLDRGLEQNPVVLVLERFDIVSRLQELLRYSKNSTVSEYAVTLLTRHFMFPSVQ